jgi:hypothetical protein
MLLTGATAINAPAILPIAIIAVIVVSSNAFGSMLPLFINTLMERFYISPVCVIHSDFLIPIYDTRD